MKEYYKCINCGRATSIYDPCDCVSAYDISFDHNSIPETTFDNTEFLIRDFVSWLIQKGIIINEQLINDYIEEN